MKVFQLTLVIVALTGGGWLWTQAKSAHARPDSAVAERLLARAEKRDIDFNVEISGDIAPAFQLEVKAEVGGKLKALHVEPGSVVHEGDLLAEIDDRDLLTEKEGALTEIEGAQLSLDRTRRNFERAKELFEGKLISREVYDNLASEFDLSKNTLVKAERKLQLVQDKLSKTKVNAPSDGTVLTVPVIEGQVVIAAASVNSGTPLMTIANLSKLLVETHINQIDVARLNIDQEVKLRAESFKDLELEATISRIAQVATIKNNVKGFQVQAVIDKPNPRLRPGMTVIMTIPIARADDVVSVPISAVFKGEGDAKVVYVRNDNGTEKREVKVGISDIDYAQILTGVEPGEQILLVEPDRAPAKRS
jgi:RND family efflux transporter MFP subunit